MRRRDADPGPQLFRYLIVRFQSHLVLGVEDRTLTATDDRGHPVDLGPFHAVVNQVGGRARQSYPRIAEDFRARSIRSTTGIDRYVDVIVPRMSSSDLSALRKRLEGLRDLIVFAVESWPYVPAGPTELDPLREKQGYLESRESGGISAGCAWQLGGGDGSGVIVCVCDVALKPHEDLPAPILVFGSPPSDPPDGDVKHANSALGVIAAIKDNEYGMTGISPGSTIWFATTNGYVNVINPAEPVHWLPFDSEVLDRIYEAMTGGGIVVLEMQAEKQMSGTTVNAPAEVNPHVRAWIREAALNRGILTVLPAGTRTPGTDLKDIDSPYIVPGTSPELWQWSKVWDGLPEDDPNHSLGVIVGGGDPHTRVAITDTNYGTRVDCQGWGTDVATTGGPGMSDYVYDFRGSSSAAAMVGGVAASLQGAYISAYGDPPTPGTIRGMLSDPTLGLPQPEADAASKPIGPLPDLAAMLRQVRILGDVYLRDDLTDFGETPYTGEKLFMSPDIIVRRVGALNADDQIFWDQYLDEDLAGDIAVGAANEVFVRLHNRSMNPGNVTVNAYWTDPGLFLAPEIWNRIGAAVSAGVPAYDHKVVKISWTEPGVPKAGKYCLIATIDSECDPLGIDGEFSSFEAYKRFLRMSNNIAHRNVQAVDLPTGQWNALFYFFLEGIAVREDWERDQGFFRLEIQGRLPRNTLLRLRPERGPRGMGSEPGGSILRDLYEVTAPMPLILRGLRLGAGARIPFSLEVTLPEGTPEGTFTFHADQYHENDHLGRMNFVIRHGRIA